MSNPSSESSLPVTTTPTPHARDRVVALLSAAFADDRIALDDLERRMTLVYSATTLAELDALVADMPATASSTAIVGGDAGAPLTHGSITAIFSNQERSGSMVVPQHLRVRAVFGNAELNLGRATFAPGITVIEASSVFGNIEITLPANVAVENTGSAILGSFELQASDSPSGGPPVATVRITGRAVFGNVEARVTRFRTIERRDDERRDDERRDDPHARIPIF